MGGIQAIEIHQGTTNRIRGPKDRTPLTGQRRAGVGCTGVWSQIVREGFFFDWLRAAAKRLAVRALAAAREAFFARAVRSSGVMFWAAVLPPSLPNLRATSVIAARISAVILTTMPLIVHLSRYGGGSSERKSDSSIDIL